MVEYERTGWKRNASFVPWSVLRYSTNACCSVYFYKKKNSITLEIFPYFGPLLSFLKWRKKYFKHLLLAPHFPVNCNLIQPWSSPVIYSNLDIHNYEYPNIAIINYNLRSLYCRLQCSFSECPLSCAALNDSAWPCDIIQAWPNECLNFSRMSLVWPVTNIPKHGKECLTECSATRIYKLSVKHTWPSNCLLNKSS
jgi:hypothetical protein